jgi:hypothetical protein
LDLDRVPEMGAAVESAAMALSVALGYRKPHKVPALEITADR